MENNTLAEMLRLYSTSGRIPFHMPGHKRSRNYDYLNSLGAALDITEIDGFDNLHNASGILAEGMALLSEVYGSKRSFYLINGSTGGLLSAVRCAVPFGGEVIAARNCHKAVYNAMELVGARPHYIYPPCDADFRFCLAVTPKSVEDMLAKYPASKAVILTSPTYDGVVSDIAAIAEICHRRKIPLIVDEAHGAHLGFLDSKVKSAVTMGADIVIQSFHKTLPSLTQTAVAHIGGIIISPEKYAAELSVFETSSPSYLLMASLDGCTRLLAEKVRRENFFNKWREVLDDFDTRLPELEKIHVFMHPYRPCSSVPAYDRSKLVLSGDGITGPAIAEILRKHNIEPEMVSAGYALLMTGADTSRKDMDALTDALKFIERTAKIQTGEKNALVTVPDIHPAQLMTPFEARQQKTETVPLDLVPDGAVSADYVFAYPPGIPVITPGEVISHEVRDVLRQLIAFGLNPSTLHGAFKEELSIIR